MLERGPSFRRPGSPSRVGPVDLDLIWLIGCGCFDLDELDCATALALQADAYLRPSEAIGLSGDSVVFARAGEVCSSTLGDAVALVIAPSEEGVPAKSGHFDETVMLGVVGIRAWVCDVAKAAFRTGPLFQISIFLGASVGFVRSLNVKVLFRWELRPT